MCIRVMVIDVLPALAVWDADDVTVLVRRSADPESALNEVLLILADLDAPLPFITGVPLCFCGDPVPLPAELTAGARWRHRTNSQHVWQVSRGA